MNFGAAIKELQDGNKVVRPSWNEKEIFAYYVSVNADKNGEVEFEAYFIINNAKGTISIWTPSVADYLAEDWEVVNNNRGKALIGRVITAGTRFKIINIESHRREGRVCLDEYIGKTGTFECSFMFSEEGYESVGTFDKEYMNAIDKENGYLYWRYDEVEILD